MGLVNKAREESFEDWGIPMPQNTKKKKALGSETATFGSEHSLPFTTVNEWSF